jgi:hypothetical protein
MKPSTRENAIGILAGATVLLAGAGAITSKGWYYAVAIICVIAIIALQETGK